ncbi:gamma-glutamylcyclotransferase family protein [Algoriphagus confluentis]|uniref:Gamma-glutamylcyclotransferase n=1 Tax=Algoriphagus confluentis TaxID=1697556 RepID=A0ABQ6PKP9_9BACT|nr:hypothetical protein Aconfl_05070 [Algoriphagus confluentis]
MFNYFGYGSNLNLISLRAKGVTPLHIQKAVLQGWKLDFSVEHWFAHEGGMGNIQPTGKPEDRVEGNFYSCPDEQLPQLDQLEAYGIGYDRIEVEVHTDSGKAKAWVYVGLPDFVKPGLLPTRRYLNLILQGARTAGLSEGYIKKLEQQEIHPFPELPEFQAPQGDFPSWKESTLDKHPLLTGLCGEVFDMSKARWKLDSLKPILGGKDMTLFHLKRHDTSTGEETFLDYLSGNISKEAKNYLNAYLHAYWKEFDYAGKLIYTSYPNSI